MTFSPAAVTKCQYERQQATSSGGRMRRQFGGAVGRFIPRCTKDGSYATLQCHGSTGYCWCVNPSNGVNTSAQVPPGQVASLPCSSTARETCVLCTYVCVCICVYLCVIVLVFVCTCVHCNVAQVTYACRHWWS